MVWWKTRVRGYAGMRICGYADMRVCGYAGMRVRRTGLTNRFQKLINNSNKIIAVNTKNHSCEGVFICGKTHVDFHLFPPFSRLIQHQYIENSFINQVTRWVKRTLS